MKVISLNSLNEALRKSGTVIDLDLSLQAVPEEDEEEIRWASFERLSLIDYLDSKC